MDEAMKYKIKNEQLAKLIYSVFDEEAVQRTIAKQIDAGWSSIYFSSNGRLTTKLKPDSENIEGWYGTISISISAEGVEQIREYYPDKWNPYPEVKPPQDGWYLVQWKKGQEGCGDEFPLGVSYWDKDETWTGIEAFRSLPATYLGEETKEEVKDEDI